MSISRRDFMSLVGGSVAGAAAVAVGSKIVSSSPAVASSNKLDAWRVAEVGQVALGAVPILLVNRASGEELRVEACGRGSRLHPVASSKRFDLFVANGGDGSARTSRDHVLVTRALARKLDRQVDAVPAGVLTMEARQRAHRGLYETNDEIA